MCMSSYTHLVFIFMSTKGSVYILYSEQKTLLCTDRVFTSFISFYFVSFFFHSILVNVNKSPLEISLAYLYFTATKFLFYFWVSSWCSSAFWDCESQAKWYVVNMKHRKNSRRRRRRRDDRKTWDNWNGRKRCCWYMCAVLLTQEMAKHKFIFAQ